MTQRKVSYRGSMIPALKKATAIMVCLLLVTASWSSPVIAKAPTVYTIKLPKESCSIKARWRGDGNKTVIHIQDAHTSVDAQKNIARTIEALVKDNDLDYVGVEGATTEINVRALQQFPSRTTRERVADWYVEKGVLSGVEKAAIASDVPFTLLGLEENELFRKNFRAYYGTQLKREDILDQLDEIESILNDLKTPIFNEALRSFAGLASAWDRGDVDLFEFVQVLEQQITAQKMPVDEYVNYAAMRETAVLKMRVPSGTLKTELLDLEKAVKRAAVSVKDTQGRAAVDRLFGLIDAFKGGALSEREYLETMKIYCPKAGIDFVTFKHANNELKYLQSYGRIDFEGVARDIRAINAGIMRALASTDDEKALVERVIMISMLDTVTSLKATEEEVAAFNGLSEQCTYEFFATFFSHMSEKYGTRTSILLRKDDFEKQITYARHFYHGAELRTDAFVGSLLNAMQRRGDEVGVLVSGGYHTKGIMKGLEEKDVSYVVINPIIESISNLCAYDEKMKGGLVALSPTMVGYITLLLLDKNNRSDDSNIVRDIHGDMALVSLASAVASAVGPKNADSERIQIMSREALTLFVDDGMNLLQTVISDAVMTGEKNIVDSIKKIIAERADVHDIRDAAETLASKIKTIFTAERLPADTSVELYIERAVDRAYDYIAGLYRQLLADEDAGEVQFEVDCALVGSHAEFHAIVDSLKGKKVRIIVDERSGVLPGSFAEDGYYGKLMKQLDDDKTGLNITIERVVSVDNVALDPNAYTLIFTSEAGVADYAPIVTGAKKAAVMPIKEDSPQLRATFTSLLLLLARYVTDTNTKDVQVSSFVNKVNEAFSAFSLEFKSKVDHLVAVHQKQVTAEKFA